MKAHVCVDCIAEENTKRPRPAPFTREGVGPLCASHNAARDRQAGKAKRLRNAGAAARKMSVSTAYGIDMLRFQKGVCAICQRATGRRKSLAYDHDHHCCPGTRSCGRCLRGRLCGPCNQMVGWLRDNPALWLTGAMYMVDSPHARMIRGVPLLHVTRQQAYGLLADLIESLDQGLEEDAS